MNAFLEGEALEVVVVLVVLPWGDRFKGSEDVAVDVAMVRSLDRERCRIRDVVQRMGVI